MKSRLMLSALIAAGLAIAPAFGQQYVYPAKGQSPDQQKKDEYECHSWAVQQTGFDPTKPQAAQAPAGPAPGSGAKGAVKGAVVGGVVGGVAGGRAGEGAAAGAVVGGIAARKSSAQQQQTAQQQQAASGSGAYNNARSACLTGRGYSVK